MPIQYSYPKNKIKVLLLEDINSNAFEKFENDGFHVEQRSTALSETELLEIIGDVHILGIRSKTSINDNVLSQAHKLLAIGAFCIGTNQIDLISCTRHGIAVFNAPYSNTRSVVELALGQIIMLARGVFLKNYEMHQGIWSKNANNSHELRGKTLGIIGYGRIGSQLSVLAESLGMKVIYYDIQDQMPLGNSQAQNSMTQVLELSDIVSLHVDGRTENSNLIDSPELAIMRDGAILINLSRGHVVNIPALQASLNSGKLAGASIDVFPEEPKSNQETFSNELQAYQNVCLTPHIGGSTVESQIAIADYVPNKLMLYINDGCTSGCVNLPEVQLPVLQNNHRILHIHANKSGMMASINQLISAHHVNINGQYLKTNDEVGYVIMDIETNYPDIFIKELKALDNTIKCRLLF